MPGALWSGLYGCSWKWYLLETRGEEARNADDYYNEAGGVGTPRSKQAASQRYLPVVLAAMLRESDRVGGYAVRAGRDVVRLQAVAAVVLDRVLVVAVQAVADGHARRAVESVLEVVADHPEVRQTHPTRLHRA